VFEPIIVSQRANEDLCSSAKNAQLRRLGPDLRIVQNGFLIWLAHALP
jgi:hypothetical protein